jgi:hypothetical protein
MYAFFSNPWVGMVGTAAGVVGVLLTIVFYLRSASYPDLVYLDSAVRTIVVKQGATSRLAVVFDGRPLTQDVTATQVALWNRGRQPIRRAAVLQPVTITTEPRVPILEATIRKTSRDVVGFDLDRTRLADGEVSVWWNILEEGDGGVVQLVYAGDVGTRIHCRGVIEGQRGVREFRVPRTTDLSPETQLGALRWERYFFLVPAIIFSMVVASRLIYWKRGVASYRGWDRLLFFIFTVGLPIVGAGVCLYMFLEAAPQPPFGF